MLIKKVSSIFLLTIITLTCVAKTPTGLISSIESQQIGNIDYRISGQQNFSVQQNTLRSASSGCEVSYTEFKPESANGEKLVVMAHGFFRNEQTQRELAEHLASWGVHLVTVGFCNSRPWNGYHDRNGEDMVSVADAMQAKQIIYSGFSAGGLSAFLAASQDERTLAYFGLDMVDNFKKGIAAAATIKVPVYALLAEPSSCNAKANGLEVFSKIDEPFLLKVKGATHCEFEFPYDKKCSWVCGKVKQPYAHDDVQATILALTTAFFLWQLGVDDDAKGWWEKEAGSLNILLVTDRVSFAE